MRDPDDFFAERLEEEASFPKRSKNWKHLSKRLDAYDAGMAQSPSGALRWWQAAAVIAILSAGVLLWKNLENRRENQALRNTIATLQQELKPSGKLPLSYVPAPSDLHTGLKPPVASATVRTPASLPVKTKLGGTKTPVLPNLLPAGASTAVAIRPDAAASETVITQGSGLETPASPTANLLAQSSQTMADSSNTGVDTTDTTAMNNAVVQTDPTLAPPAATRPVQRETVRFRVGAQATIGLVMPVQAGVSALRGQGFHFEARVFRSLWATAGIDWLQQEVSTTELVPRFHHRHDTIPKPPGPPPGPGGPPPPPKLILVESAPRQQQLSLGLRYELPFNFWVKPSLRLSHTWVRVAPTLVTFKFEKVNPPGPGEPPRHEYTAEKFDARWHQNQWRLGLGLEKSITDWTFVVSADYSKDFSVNTPSFDALYLRAGAQYRF